MSRVRPISLLAPLDTPCIIKDRSRQNPPASGLCLPKLQRNHNSSVLKILQIISFVFKILQNQQPVSGLFGILCTNRSPGGGTPCRSQFQTSTATRPATITRPQPTSVAARPTSVIFLYPSLRPPSRSRTMALQL